MRSILCIWAAVILITATKTATAQENDRLQKGQDPTLLQAGADLLKNAQEGDAEAQFNLALTYGSGNWSYGINRDYDNMMKYMRLAAEQGHAEAQYYLGVLLSVEFSENRNEAAKWYSLSANQGFADAQFQLGVAFFDGEGVEQDFKKALYWWRTAAEVNHLSSQILLGDIYRRGDGVSQSWTVARKWYRMAADQNSGKAKYWIGRGFYFGEGVQEDEDEAFVWISEAARSHFNETLSFDNEEKEAIELLSVFYFVGVGTDQDPIRGYAWEQILKLLYNYQETVYLDVLRQTGIYPHLSAEQIDEAMTLMRICLLSGFENC